MLPLDFLVYLISLTDSPKVRKIKGFIVYLFDF